MTTCTLIHKYLSRTAKKVPAKIALVCDGIRWSYSEIDRLSDVLAANLKNLGLRPLDRVAIFLDNCAEFVISFYGALKAGGIAVPVNGLIRSPKLRYILNDCDPEILIAAYGKSAVVLDAIQGNKDQYQVIWLDDRARIPAPFDFHSSPWKECVEPGFCHFVKDSPKVYEDGISEHDLAAIIYTSGSTGEPKGIMCPHSSMLAAANSIISYIQNNERDIILDALPLSFDYGLYQILMAFIFGGTVVLEKSFAFPQQILKRIEQERVTGFPVVPTMAALMLRARNFQQFDFTSLRYMTSTGAVLPPAHITKLKEFFPGVNIFSMYGLTECKRVAYLPLEELSRRPDSVGIPMPNCQVFLVNNFNHKVKPGEVGELVVTGPNVMRGYWNAPELTAGVFRQGYKSGERFLYTGDLFRQDEEGYLYYISRTDDMIKIKGERVSPKEIENVLCLREGVLEAAVIGLPDEILGQAITAFIIVDTKCTVTEKDILKHCREKLESFMIPRNIVFIQALPKTEQGKIDKQLLGRIAGGNRAD